MKHVLFVLLLLAIMVVSCTQVYKEWEKESFSTLSWMPEQEIRFYPEIEDTTQSYKLTLGVRHLYESRIDQMDLVVKSISPSGKEQIENYTLQLKDEGGKSLASCAGNICDLESVVNSNLNFSETGKYTFVIALAPGKGRIVGIMEFGFIIHSKE